MKHCQCKIGFMVFFTLLSLSVAAQKASTEFYGYVVDAFTRQPIDSEVACSLLRPDSAVMMTTKSYQYTTTDSGLHTCFKFDVSEQADGHFIVRLEAKGYETVYKAIKLAWKSKPLEIMQWNIPMRRTSRTTDETQLGEVTVKATKVKFYTKGDTLVYNADAANSE